MNGYVALGGLIGILLGHVIGSRLFGGEWFWQNHLSSKCRCGILYDPTDQCPGSRMGRGPKVRT